MQALRIIDKLLKMTAATADESKEQESNDTNNNNSNTALPKIILGAMEMGRRLDMDQSTQIGQHFCNNSTRFEIDTAYMYQGGKTDKYLSTMNEAILDPNHALIATKACPKFKHALKPEGVRQQLDIALQRLKRKSVDLFYLHWPDYKNPIIDTLRAVNDLYKEGKFQRFGLSNYPAWQVAEIYYLCQENGFLTPCVYQGMYNAVSRQVESELLPCLRRFDMAFYAYCPLAGGVLSGKHKYADHENKTVQKGRFFGDAFWPTEYRRRFWTKGKFGGIECVQKALLDAYGVNETTQKCNVSMVAASLKWLTHHSRLTANDGVVLGCGSYNHFAENLAALEDRQPLADNVAQAFEVAWDMSKGDDLTYWR